jgi:hypothetical protein
LNTASAILIKRSYSLGSNAPLSSGITVLICIALTGLIITLTQLGRRTRDPKSGAEELDEFMANVYNRARGQAAIYVPTPPKRKSQQAQKSLRWPVKSIFSSSSRPREERDSDDGPPAAEVGEAVAVEDVQRCAELLREMYALDLQIWGLEGGDGAEAEAKKRQAEGVLRELKAIASAWETAGRGALTDEDQVAMDAICTAIREEKQPRYT